MTLEKLIAKEEKEKKDKYLHPFLERRRHFTPLFLSANGIPGVEARAATQIMASHLSFMLKREYSEMCGFFRASVALSILQSNTLLLWGLSYK